MVRRPVMKVSFSLGIGVAPQRNWPIGNSPLAVLLNPKRDITKFAKLLPTRDPGVVSIEGGKGISAFVNAARNGRIWDREVKVRSK
jgi:hypothetical protein